MNKLARYITNGKGIGALFLLLSSLIFSSFLSIYVYDALLPSIPHIQEIADEVLPIRVENGQVTVPQNTLKELNVFGQKSPAVFPFVIDTTVDSINTSQLSKGIYLSRSYIYAVNDREIRSYKLSGSFDLPKQDYTDILKSGAKWVAFGLFIFYGIGFFIFMLLLTLFFAFVTRLAGYINKREFSFDAKMRLNTLLLIGLSVVAVLFSRLGYHMSGLTFFAVMVALQIIIVRKLPQA